MGKSACTHNAQEITAAMQKAHISFAGKLKTVRETLLQIQFYHSISII
jgi:hypothetical protein